MEQEQGAEQSCMALGLSIIPNPDGRIAPCAPGHLIYRQDVLAGVTVGVIALSLSMALGIASESTPAIG